MGAARETSAERPGGVRGVPGRRPRSLREASEGRPGSVRELSERRPNCVPKAFVAKPGPRFKTSGDSVWSCLTLSVRTAKLPSVVEGFRGGAFSTAGAMKFHDFAKPPRLCRKLKTAAPVHKNCTGNCENVLRTRVVSLNRAFSPCLCRERQWASSRKRIGSESERYVSINRCD